MRCQFYTTIALQTVLKSDIASMIDRESKGNNLDGVIVDVLANQSGLDSDLLGRSSRSFSCPIPMAMFPSSPHASLPFSSWNLPRDQSRTVRKYHSELDGNQ